MDAIVGLRFQNPTAYLIEHASHFRRIALAATALEARYLPKLDPEWVHLTNVNFDEWDQYRKSFDPVAVSRVLNYTGEQAAQDAERLLALARSIDPLGGSWGGLARRAPSKARNQLKDAALSAMDLRETAEILLLFSEDFAQSVTAQTAEGQPVTAPRFHEERLSYRRDSLDERSRKPGDISPSSRCIGHRRRERGGACPTRVARPWICGCARAYARASAWRG